MDRSACILFYFLVELQFKRGFINKETSLHDMLMFCFVLFLFFFFALQFQDWVVCRIKDKKRVPKKGDETNVDYVPQLQNQVADLAQDNFIVSAHIIFINVCDLCFGCV